MHRSRPATSLLLTLLLLFLTATAALAQFDTASVLGYVRDSTGAAISASTVTLTNTETSIAQTLKTDGSGRYEFSSVPIGSYRVAATAAGFSPTQVAPFRVTVNARQRVDLDLKSGSVTESVTVTSAPTLLETETSSRGQVIFPAQIQDLPLNGRSYADLALLTPGVRRSVLENGTTTSREASFNVNGQRSAFNNFLLDGLDNNNYGTSNQGFANENIAPSPDAVGEFRIETDNYSAEYGRASGAVINVSIRRGTNQFHGRAWDFNRNTSFNAIGPFAPVLGVKPSLIRNQFGGTFGGPIIKDRTFFFADYEGLRQISKVVTQVTLPTPEQRSGTFLLHRVDGSTAPIPLQNPVSGAQDYNGVVPTSQQTAFSAAVLSALPSNSVAVAGAGGFGNNYISTPRGTVGDDKGDVRVDHKLRESISLFGTYSQHAANIVDPNSIPGPAGGSQSNGTVHITNRQIAAGVTWIITPNSLLDARFAYTSNVGAKIPFGVGQTSLLTANGITNGIPTNPAISRYLNGQSVSGFTQFGAQTSSPQFQNPDIYNPKVNYTFIHGIHSVKIGYEFQAISTAIDDFNPVYGQDNYGGGFAAVSAANCVGAQVSTATAPCTPTDTAAGNTASTQITQARNLADFMFGNRSSYQLNNYVVINLLQKANYMYVQDDIKLRPNLTLNAGLRYELVTPQYVQGNHLANFSQVSPTTGALIQATDGSLYSRGLVHMPLNNLGPRIGFSYSPDTRSTVRGGYGISYTQFNREGGENLLAYNGPYIVGATINQTPSLGLCTSDTQDQTTCFRQTQQGYSTSLVSPAAFNPLKVTSRYIPAHNPTGYVQSYQLSVQRQLPGQVVLDLAYVGNKSTHLMVLGDQNQAVPQTVSSATCAINPSGSGTATYISSGCASLQSRRPTTNFAGVEVATGVGYSNYNALQFKVEKTAGHGIYFINSFAWSRAFDDASGHLETSFGDNSRVNLANPRADYGVSGYDQPINNTTSITYDLPYGTGRRFGGNAPWAVRETLGGWQLTLINTANSGVPLNLNYSINSGFTVSDLLNYRPNVTGQVLAPSSSYVKTSTSLNGFYNTAAVSVPTSANPFGNAQRNSQRGPFFNQLDLGLHKDFTLWREGTVIDFRGEAFNLLNHVNYTGPDTNRSNSTFGSITGFFPARQLQVAAKLIF